MRVDLEHGERVDERLAEALLALASPVRLALLRETRTPKLLDEIRIAREGVRDHLDLLLAAGVVTPRETERDDAPTVEYVLNHQALFALAEELRELARLRHAPERSPASGTPRLVLVKGLGEGRSFDLTPPASGEREWVIGRRRGLDVTLDFDPFVSTENALVSWSEGAHFVSDLPTSRNGTAVNFAPLAPGDRVVLAPGDVIGVGRSLLLYRA